LDQKTWGKQGRKGQEMTSPKKKTTKGESREEGKREKKRLKIKTHQWDDRRPPGQSFQKGPRAKTVGEKKGRIN